MKSLPFMLAMVICVHLVGSVAVGVVLAIWFARMMGTVAFSPFLLVQAPLTGWPYRWLVSATWTAVGTRRLDGWLICGWAAYTLSVTFTSCLMIRRHLRRGRAASSAVE